VNHTQQAIFLNDLLILLLRWQNASSEHEKLPQRTMIYTL